MPDPVTPDLAADEALLLTQLLCTRLCHDLAGPIGAVAAGVELTSGDPTQVDQETLSLIGSSSAAASRKLKFLRAALGIPPAGAAAVGTLPALIDGYLEATAGRGGVPELQWATADESALLAQRLGPVAAPLLLNLCLLVLEALPVCRRLVLRIAKASSLTVTLEGHGETQREASWRPDVAEAVALGPTAALSAKTIQPHLTGRLASRAGCTLVLRAEPHVLSAVLTLA